MAYSVAWDETEPDGSEDAGTIDDIIRDLKIALRERLEQVIEDFGDDSVDPKELSESASLSAAALVLLYHEDNSVGTKGAIDPGLISYDERFVLIECDGTTNGSGELTIDKSELTDLEGVTALSALIPVVCKDADVLIDSWTGSPDITVTFKNYSGAAVTSTFVTFYVIAAGEVS